MAVYSVMLLLVMVLGAPYWLWRMMTSGRYRAGLSQRLGRVPLRLREAVRGRQVVWVHAVSVGEVVAAMRLIEALRERQPGFVFAVSTTTETGQKLARQKLGEDLVFYLPLDLGVLVRRYLRALRPRLLVLMESELWPNLILECSAQQIPIAVANARVSDRSFPRYMRLRRLWRPLLQRISLFLAQNSESMERLTSIGALPEQVVVTGNIKYDSRADLDRPVLATLRAALAGNTRVLVCGSTLEDEERRLLEAWSELLTMEPDAVMVLAPRHPYRFQSVFELVYTWGLEAGVQVHRATTFDSSKTLRGGSILLLDTIGDLAAVYSLGAAAFVGGSLVRSGGHNPLEAAQFGVPVVMGDSYENFREMVERMRAADAIAILPGAVSAEALGRKLGTVLRGGEEVRRMGEQGQIVFTTESGAAARTADALVKLLERPAGALR